MIFQTVLENYSSKSTTHGVSYIFEKNAGLCPRIFWSIVLIASFALSGFMIYSIFKQWEVVIDRTFQNFGWTELGPHRTEPLINSNTKIWAEIFTEM